MKLAILALTLPALAIAAPAHAQFFGSTVDNNTVIGGLAGAGIGGAIGSNIAGSGNRDEGTAIGALIGGLAGAGIGNRRSNFYGNPYAGSYNPGFNGRNLLGTAVGVGLGGAIGSNLAGSGVREEGTALGALIGGVAGYALSNRRAGGAWNGYGGYGYDAPAYAPVGGPVGGYGGSYGGGFQQPVYSQPTYVQPSYRAPTTTTFAGYVPGRTYTTQSTFTQPTYSQPTYSQPTYVQPSPLPVVPTTTSYYYSHSCHTPCR